MLTDSAQPYIRNRHRPARSLVFGLGLLFGLVVGTIGGYSAATARAQANGERPAWSTALICRGRAGDIFFVENQIGRDYRLASDYILMERAGIGLLPSKAQLTVPILIPQAETVGIRIECAPAGLVLFDLNRRIRITLEASK